MIKKLVLSLTLSALASLSLLASETSEFYRLTSFSNTEENAGMRTTVCGIVTHVSNLRKGLFLIAATDKPYRFGIPVQLPRGIPPPEEGDEVWVTGHTANTPFALSVDAESYVKVNSLALDFETRVRYDRLRKGLIDLRRVVVDGKVESVSLEKSDPEFGEYTVLRVKIKDAIALVRVPGTLKKRDYIGKHVKIIGCVFPVPDGTGGIATRVVEARSAEDIETITEMEDNDWSKIAIFVGGTSLSIALLVTFIAWIRSRREALQVNAVAAERKRMAADLHDTIEQHLACVRLLISSTLNNDVIPEATREALIQASSVLANAKVEVRDAVMNLRSDEALKKSPEEALNEVAALVGQGGKVSCSCSLKGLPERLPQGRYQDLLAIVREAITNAIKHGHANKIALESVPGQNGGFLLQVKNNGTPFDAASALGPETGHFGLSGIQLRASRSKFKVTYLKDGDWMVLNLEAEK